MVMTSDVSSIFSIEKRNKMGPFQLRIACFLKFSRNSCGISTTSNLENSAFLPSKGHHKGHLGPRLLRAPRAKEFLRATASPPVVVSYF